MDYQFAWAWVDGQFRPNVRLAVSDSGIIQHVQTDLAFTSPSDARRLSENDFVELVSGIALPGMINVHSHAFQWALAGRSELRTQSTDSFWTWREQMFRMLTALDGDLMDRIARDVYGEMVKAGYTAVGEFHYVHREPDGTLPVPITKYADILIRAALDSGLAICLLPALYQRGGFDDAPLRKGQRRFYLSDQEFWTLMEALNTNWQGTPRVHIGMAIHSLRAVSASGMRRAAAEFHDRFPQGVIHIHVAEQHREVDECLAATGRRPVQWLLDEMNIDHRWSLIHATHATPDELRRVAWSAAVVGLCPTTEANLGDGIFDAECLITAGGRWGIGSDSQMSVNPADELRWLEYGQRLKTHRRAVLADHSHSCGEFMWEAAARGGARSLGIPAGELRSGCWADLVVIDLDTPGRLWSASELRQSAEFSSVARQIDRHIFATGGRPRRVMSAGKWRW